MEGTAGKKWGKRVIQKVVRADFVPEKLFTRLGI